MDFEVLPAGVLRGTISVPGDKSISHRAVIIGSISSGTTEVLGFLPGEDCLSTVRCMQNLGVSIERKGETNLLISGCGLKGLEEPADVLDCGNSGTTMRLLMGVLVGQDFYSVLSGDDSLRRRPMDRITAPLSSMGAEIWGRGNGYAAPISIRGTGSLTPLRFSSPIASAQVKSAVLLAGLYAGGRTTVTEPEKSRDHTERMLRSFGAQIIEEERSASVEGFPNLTGKTVAVPGDISSAAFFLVAGCIVPGSEVIIQNVGLNFTRSGIIDILLSMGARMEIFNERQECGEPVGDILVRHNPLQAVTISGEIIPRLIDELPVIAVAACAAEGTTTINGAGELRVKETDRIACLCEELRRMGARVTELEDGMVIEGPVSLNGCRCCSHGDHRIAMALTVAALTAGGRTVIEDAECINISFPGFRQTLERLQQ